MKRILLFSIFGLFLFNCQSTSSTSDEKKEQVKSTTKEVPKTAKAASATSASKMMQDENKPEEIEIVKVWKGQLHTDYITELPEACRETSIGYIKDQKTFDKVMKGFTPKEEEIEKIDFDKFIVMYKRNTKYLNTINVLDAYSIKGMVNLLAMESRSSRPVEDHVVINLVLIEKEGIIGISTKGEKVKII